MALLPRRFSLLAALLFAALAFAQQPPVAILHVHVIPMDRERVLDDHTVVIADGKIAEIGPTSSVKVPPSAKKIDGSGRYLIPGLTDAHVHLYSAIEFRLYIANGVTTVFNLDGRPAHVLWRKQVANGEILGPTIFTTGPIFGRAHQPEEVVRLVDEQADAGYDDDDNEHFVLDESKISVVAKETAEAGVYVIPTLSTYATTVQQATDLDSFLKNPVLRYLSPWALEAYEPANNRFRSGTSPEQAAHMRAALVFQRKLVKALFDAGVPLMVGTDAPDVGPMAGFGIHKNCRNW